MVLTYDPNSESLLNSIEEPNLNEEIARASLVRIQNAQAALKVPEKASVPTGLLKNEDILPKKDVEQSQMAEFGTSIDELMPSQQNDIPQQAPQDDPPKKSKKGTAPFGLTNDQFTALLAGVAAVVAFSRPVQSRLTTMVPKFIGENGDVSMMGLAITGLIAAIIFYFAKNYSQDFN
jgi:hypothetical protein